VLFMQDMLVPADRRGCTPASLAGDMDIGMEAATTSRCYSDLKPERAARSVMKERWKDEPDEHDYPAAHDYLTLIVDETSAGQLVNKLTAGALTHRKAKDILRAARLPLLPQDNPHVSKDLTKVNRGQLLSPVLLVRGQTDAGPRIAGELLIADGYHRVCASYHLDEDTDIPCKLI